MISPIWSPIWRWNAEDSLGGLCPHCRQEFVITRYATEIVCYTCGLMWKLDVGVWRVQIQPRIVMLLESSD